MKRTLAVSLAALFAAGMAQAEIRIAHIYGKTGALEAYAAQSHTGLMMGLEYATGGHDGDRRRTHRGAGKGHAA